MCILGQVIGGTGFLLKARQNAFPRAMAVLSSPCLPVGLARPLDDIWKGMSKLLVVTLGGAIGSGARYLLGSFVQAATGNAFPLGILVVNVIGSFLVCAIMHVGLATSAISPTLRLFLTTGLMGGFTTYSAFDYETYRYTQQGAYALAAVNVGLTLVACFAAGAAGDAVAKLVFRN
jgi:CrcB protein